MVSQYHCPLRGTRDPGAEITESKARAEKNKTSLDYLISESKQVLKNKEDISKEFKSQLRGASTSQIQDNLGIKINNCSND